MPALPLAHQPANQQHDTATAEVDVVWQSPTAAGLVRRNTDLVAVRFPHELDRFRLDEAGVGVGGKFRWQLVDSAEPSSAGLFFGLCLAPLGTQATPGPLIRGHPWTSARRFYRRARRRAGKPLSCPRAWSPRPPPPTRSSGLRSRCHLRPRPRTGPGSDSTLDPLAAPATSPG